MEIPYSGGENSPTRLFMPPTKNLQFQEWVTYYTYSMDCPPPNKALQAIAKAFCYFLQPNDRIYC